MRRSKGSPYYWQEPVNAFLKLKSKNKPYNDKLNVNLHQHKVEVYTDNNYVELDYAMVMMISIPSQRIIVSPYKNQIIFQIYNGKTYRLVNTPRIVLEKIVHRIPGKNITREKFSKKNSYMLSYGDNDYEIETNNKSINKVLDKDAIDIAKNNHNELKSEQDLLTLLKLLEED